MENDGDRKKILLGWVMVLVISLIVCYYLVRIALYHIGT